MQPTTSRDFQRAANQRLVAAHVLLRGRLTLDAQYVAGYTVECTLKALILEKTPLSVKSAKLAMISSGKKMHAPAVLLNELRNLGVQLPVEIAKRMRKFRWSTDLRYETGRLDTGETIAFLKTAGAVYDWVEGQLP
jgi:hypothetical protein